MKKISIMKVGTYLFLVLFWGLFFFYSCSEKEKTKVITIDNRESDSLRIIYNVQRIELEEIRAKNDLKDSVILSLLKGNITEEQEDEALKFIEENEDNRIN